MEGVVTITDSAAKELRILLDDAGDDNMALEFGVVGGGCSGLQYGLALVQIEDDDVVTTVNGIKLIVDQHALPMITGSTIDFNGDDLVGGGFTIDNPNATRSCGCGSSFSSDVEPDESGGCGGCAGRG